MSLKQNIENYLTEHIIDKVVDIVKTCSHNGCNVTVAEHEAEALASQILTLIQQERDERVEKKLNTRPQPERQSCKINKAPEKLKQVFEDMCIEIKTDFSIDVFYDRLIHDGIIAQQEQNKGEWVSVEDNTIETIVEGFSDRIKVPGGWIYRYWNDGCREINSSVFVPQPPTNTEEEG